MKVSEAQAICNDFNPVKGEDGKTRCKHIADGDACKLPTHFMCDVAAVVKKPPVTLSMTKVQEWQKCNRAWGLRYFYKVDAPKVAPWKRLGRAFAVCRAKIDSGQPWEIPPDVFGDDRIRLEVILEEYAKLPAIPGNSEVPFQFLLDKGPPDRVLIGNLDKLTPDRKKIYEWKYTVSPDSYTRTKIALQAASYFSGIPEAEEFIIAVARKPQQERLLATPIESRQYTQEKITKCKMCKGTGCLEVDIPSPCENCKGAGKIVEPRRLYAKQRDRDETDVEYKERIRASVGATGSFFTFKTFLRREFDINGDLYLMRAAYRGWTEATNLPGFFPNYSACDDCDFREVCESHVQGPGCRDPECQYKAICEKVVQINIKKNPALYGQKVA